MIPCRRCSGRHPIGAHQVGKRVLVKATGPRSDGLQAGTPGTVALYRILAGAAHQEVHVRLDGKRPKGKPERIVVFAPCELTAAPSPAAATAPTYERLTREEFRSRLRGYGRVVVRVMAEP